MFYNLGPSLRIHNSDECGQRLKQSHYSRAGGCRFYMLLNANALEFDTSNICSAVFTLAINRLHSFKRQPFWFHSLNSMVPVKGIDLFY